MSSKFPAIKLCPDQPVKMDGADYLDALVLSLQNNTNIWEEAARVEERKASLAAFECQELLSKLTKNYFEDPASSHTLRNETISKKITPEALEEFTLLYREAEQAKFELENERIRLLNINQTSSCSTEENAKETGARLEVEKAKAIFEEKSVRAIVAGKNLGLNPRDGRVADELRNTPNIYMEDGKFKSQKSMEDPEGSTEWVLQKINISRKFDLPFQPMPDEKDIYLKLLSLDSSSGGKLFLKLPKQIPD